MGTVLHGADCLGHNGKNKSKKTRFSRGVGLSIFGTKIFLLLISSQPDSK
jgi:hypothetical protein